MPPSASPHFHEQAAAGRRELDTAIVLRADVLVTDYRAQAQIEAAEFIDLAKEGKLDWSHVHELGDVVIARRRARRRGVGRADLPARGRGGS